DGDAVDRSAVHREVPGDAGEGHRAVHRQSRRDGRGEGIARERVGVGSAQAIGAMRRRAARTWVRALVRVLVDVPGGEEVVRLAATRQEVVVEVDRVLAGRQALDRQAEGDDVT